jgi:hypothetical protein
MRWARHVAVMGERKSAYRVFIGKPQGKRRLAQKIAILAATNLRFP